MTTLPKPHLCAMMRQERDGLYVSAVSQDVDVFRDLWFIDLNDALRYLEAHFHRLYKVTVNIPANVRRS